MRSSQGSDGQSWNTNFLTEEEEDQQKGITELNRCLCRTVQEQGSVPCPKCFSPTWDASPVPSKRNKQRKRTVTSWQKGHPGVVRIYWAIFFFSGVWQWNKILTKVLVRHYQAFPAGKTGSSLLEWNTASQDCCSTESHLVWEVSSLP